MELRTSDCPSGLTAISINGAQAARANAGWPLVIAGSLSDHPSASASDIHMRLLAAGGQVVFRPFEAKLQPPLDSVGEQTRFAVWTVPPSITAALEPGRYVARCGSASASVLLRAKESLEEQTERAGERLLLFSEWSELEGEIDEALQFIDELLQLWPGSVLALLRRSDLLERKGDLHAAVRTLDQASEQYKFQDGSGKELPSLIHRRKRRMLKALLDQLG